MFFFEKRKKSRELAYCYCKKAHLADLGREGKADDWLGAKDELVVDDHAHSWILFLDVHGERVGVVLVAVKDEVLLALQLVDRLKTMLIVVGGLERQLLAVKFAEDFQLAACDLGQRGELDVDCGVFASLQHDWVGICATDVEFGDLGDWLRSRLALIDF